MEVRQGCIILKKAPELPHTHHMRDNFSSVAADCVSKNGLLKTM